ncbi:unnamed protein product [Phaeothamnion confervicola]
MGSRLLCVVVGLSMTACVFSLLPQQALGRGGERKGVQGSGSGHQMLPLAATTAPAKDAEPSFAITEEITAYTGWRSVVKRTVRFPTGKEHTFDVVKHDGPAVLVFIWDTKTQTTTLIREYSPGQMGVLPGVVAGLVEGKHASALQAAQFELDEEANLCGGQWYPCLEGEGVLIPASKYATDRFHVYLVVDPEESPDPRPLDDGEWIQVASGVGLPELRQMMLAGEMTAVSALCCYMGLEKLREIGLHPEQSRRVGFLRRTAAAASSWVRAALCRGRNKASGSA